jgi:hypothetical protein
MSRPIFRLLAGVLGVIFIAVGVLLAFIYDDLWRKICSITFILAGIFYGFYALRGKK